MKSLAGKPCEEWLWWLGLFSLEKGLRGDPIAICDANVLLVCQVLGWFFGSLEFFVGL